MTIQKNNPTLMLFVGLRAPRPLLMKILVTLQRSNSEIITMALLEWEMWFMGQASLGLVTVTSITDANNLVLSSPQSLSNGTLLYFGVSITDAVVGTSLYYTDQDGTSDRNYYRRDQLGIPNGKIDNLGPGRYFATVDNGLGCRKTLSYNVSAPDELLWASTTERPLLAAGVSAIDYITTTRDLNELTIRHQLH